MEIVHCSTNDMTADFYTKQLQGKQFYRLINIIMGRDTSTVKECVEENSVKDTVDSTMKHVSKKMSEREYQAQDSILAVILTSSKKEA